MSDDCCIVAVDVGNTAVKLALQFESSIEYREIRIGSTGWELSAIGWVRDKLGAQHAAGIQLNGGSPRFTDQRRHSYDMRSSPLNLMPRSSWSLGPMCRSESMLMMPDRVGIDRLLSAYSAWIEIQFRHRRDRRGISDHG